MIKNNAQKSTKNIVKDALAYYLFTQIQEDQHYQAWERSFELPSYITENLVYPLRNYQEAAVKSFIYLFERRREEAKHLLFNMATGTGKTLTMAALVLYLYKQGYRNFVFMVHQIQIKEQAERNFTDRKFGKYLFKRNGVRIGGRLIDISSKSSFLREDQHGINFVFLSSAGLYNRLKNDRENAISLEDFKNYKSVIIADEAHRLNVETKRKKTLTDEEEITNWENAVQAILKVRPDNMLLEFTATVELTDPNILEKYKDKLLYRYEFSRFMEDGYSKEVKTLYNQATEVVDQKRLLILNAVALSQYRKLFAEKMGMRDPSGKKAAVLTPIILFKSVKIKQSEEDREAFHRIVASLTPDDFAPLRELGRDISDQDRTLSRLFTWIGDSKNGLASPRDPDGLKGFIQTIQEDFSQENTLTYNSQKKENAELLTKLDQPHNRIRAIFSVNALNEGWDVLSLFDIVHFDISEKKKVSLQDVQLIGRGARLFPYQLPKINAKNAALSLLEETIGEDSYKRKFDARPQDERRILETLYYHFVKTGNFLEDLQKNLLEEGIIRRKSVKRTLYMKEHFKLSETYKKGFVLMNRKEARKKEPDEVIKRVLSQEIEVRDYRLHAHSLLDKAQNKSLTALEIEATPIKIAEPYFSKHLIKKALLGYEDDFFSFDRLSQHIIGLKGIEEFIENHLSCFEIHYKHEAHKTLENLEPREKLYLLTTRILPEVQKIIDRDLPRSVGGKAFYPVPVSLIFGEKKDLWIMGRRERNAKGEIIEVIDSERARGQTDHEDMLLRCDLSKADWYVYDENYGTSEEKLFVKFIETQIEDLKARFEGAEIYLLRNELDYCVFDIENGRRFAPDYLMFIHDIRHKKFYYQCLFEAKGGHLLEHDQWKEEALREITKQSELYIPEEPFILGNEEGAHHVVEREFLNSISRDNYDLIKCLGFKFFNEASKRAFLTEMKRALEY